MRKDCLDLLARKEEGSEESLLIYQQIAASYHSHPPKELSKEDAILLLKGLFLNKIHTLKKNKTTEHLKDQIERASWRWKKEVANLLNGPHGPEICHEIARCMDPSVKKQSWDCTSHYPICVSQDGRCTINMDDLTMKVGNNTIINFDDFDLIPSFKKVFTREDYTFKTRDSILFEFTDEHGKLNVIDLDKEFIRQKQDQGGWYEYKPMEKLDDIFKHLPKEFKYLCQQATLWASIEPDAAREIIVQDTQGQITHRLPVEQKPPGSALDWTLGEPQKLNVPDAPWHLVDIQHGPNTAAAALLGQGMLWKDAKNNLRELEFPSLGLLHMKLESSTWQAYSREYPGYHLSPNQRYRGLEAIPNAYVLENKEGKRKLVIPLGEIQPKPEGSFGTKFDIAVADDSQTRNMAFDLDPEV